ncbi:phosphopentomutase [Mesorhizobium sp. YIM 152430]|uniref:phosphopentomutase n=1 Tax=Mesorhizobium sp. YIM 152430 TaxID=3031761 RepID=UPI0023DB2E4C|nr:phosphopentomutase [Mesorhizobium sp. YIM 152430]MDF1598816.1 phosphopentomutase [Mesorhizobium sp. YIM 152430]
MRRAFLFVLDSFGIGHAPDAELFGDAGSDTLGHIAEQCARGKADRPGLREGPLHLPNLARLGLFHAADLAAGRKISADGISGFFGSAQEISSGKDTPSGHWEMAGVPVTFDWGYFPDENPAFPNELVAAIIAEGDVPGILGNCHASGTEIIARHGEEHVRTGKPICYSSADSVLQIAAHETHFGMDRLHALCRTVRRLVDPLNIGRVIARPFIGDTAETFQRTANRRDYAVPPPEPTLMDRVIAGGGRSLAVGKIGDIFAHRGVSHLRKAPDNMAMFDRAVEAMGEATDGDLVFANFVDFDTLFGHQRDVAGYAAALEAFDRRLPEALDRLQPGDLLILTADHGCDPTFRGTDHTREQVPIVGAGPGLKPGSVGVRRSFADIGETIAEHLRLAPGPHGRSFYASIAADA